MLFGPDGRILGACDDAGHGGLRRVTGRGGAQLVGAVLEGTCGGEMTPTEWADDVPKVPFHDTRP